MSFSAFAPAMAPGSGRFVDYELDLTGYAATNKLTTATNAPAALPGFSRISGQNGSSVAGSANGFQYTNLTAAILTVTLDRFCVSLPASGVVIATLTSYITSLLTTNNAPWNDGPICWRYSVVWGVTPNGSGTNGNNNGLLFVNTPSASGISALGGAGFGVVFTTLGVPTWVAVNGSGTSESVAIAPAAGTGYHTCDVIVQGASKTQNAMVFVSWDNVQVLARTWGTDASLPTPDTSATMFAPIAQISNAATSALTGLRVCSFRVIAAPTLQALY